VIKSARALTFSSYAAMLFLGIADALVGSAARQIGLSAPQIGQMIATQNVGFGIGVMVSGSFADTHPKPRILMVGSIILALACLAFYRVPIFWVNCLVMFFVGLVIGSYEGVTDTMLLDLHPDQAASYININHFWVGVGKTGLAVYVMLLALNWRASVTQSGVAVLVLAGVFALSYLPVRGGVRSNFGERVRVLTRDWTVAVFFVLAVLAVGIEACSIGIMTTFLVVLRGFSASQAQMGLIVYVAAIGLGRLIVGLLVRSGRVAQWTVALFGAGVPLFLLLSFANLGPLTWLVIFAAGLGLSACLPLVLSLGGTRFPEMAGTVLGALKVGIPIGGILLPFLLSLVSSAAGLPVAMAILPAAFLIGLVLLAVNTATLFGPLPARSQVSPER